MSREAVDQAAKRLGLPATRRGNQPDESFVSKGALLVILRFDEQGLVTFQEFRQYGLMGLEAFPRVNLCTGEVTGFATLTIKAPIALLGATVWLDGDQELNLPPSDPPTEIVQRSVGSVPSGSHELTIQKAGFEPIVRHFHTDVNQETAEVLITPDEIKKGSPP